jgi:hypothetical protein
MSTTWRRARRVARADGRDRWRLSASVPSMKPNGVTKLINVFRSITTPNSISIRRPVR